MFVTDDAGDDATNDGVWEDFSLDEIAEDLEAIDAAVAAWLHKVAVYDRNERAYARRAFHVSRMLDGVYVEAVRATRRAASSTRPH